MIVINGWVAEIVDIETAFLYENLDETIYMTVPEGYETVAKDKKVDRSRQYMMLVKTIYGLTQAARQFYKKLTEVLTTDRMAMKKCLSDQCFFYRKTKAGVVIIVIYIDDTLCVRTRETVNEFKRDLAQHFSTKEEGDLTEYVGCEITRHGRKTLFMSRKYLIQKLERSFTDKVTKLAKYDTPSTAGFRVIRCLGEKLRIDGVRQKLYRSGVGILLILVKFSRPDISNIVRELSKANDGATAQHFKGLLRVIKYVIDTREKGLKYDVEQSALCTFVA